MFVRKDETYVISDKSLANIMKDPAHPLGQITKILPENATVLDIGAGNGMLGRVLRHAGKKVIIDAIEPSEFAAQLADPFYRKVYRGYAQEHSGVMRAARYDYIVLADVIEHIPDPSTFLSEILQNIPDTCKVLVSMPNVAFGGVRLALLNGTFEYVDSGLLERTHLRFFTLTTALRLFSQLQIFPERILSLERSFYRMEFSRKMLGAMPFTIINLARKSEARAYQYLFVLAKMSGGTKTEHYGASALNILVDALFAWPFVKKIVRRWRGR